MQELLSEMSNPNWDRLSFDARYEMFDKLLDLEKEQIVNAFEVGYKSCDIDEAFEINRKLASGELHYNKNYKNK